MIRRAVSGALWFLAVGWVFQFASLAVDLPWYLGTLAALAVGGFFAADPFHLVWGPDNDRLRGRRIVHEVAGTPAVGDPAGRPA